MDSGDREQRRTNPRDRANFVSFLTFAYTAGLFRRGFRGDLQDGDVYAIPDDCASKLCADRTELAWKQEETIIKLLWKRFGRRYVILSTIHLVWTLFNSIAHPYITSKFIAYFRPNSIVPRSAAYFYGGAVVALSLFHCVWAHNYFMFQCKLEIQIKASLTSLVYRKVLKLRPGEITETSMGNIVTILTKDVKMIVHNIWTVSEMIIGTIQTVTVFGLLFWRMGPPSFIAMAMLFCGLLIQVFLSRTITKMRLKVGKMADKRLQLTRDVLSALRIIKMYTWERFFDGKICDARKKEMRKTMTAYYLKICLILIGIMGSKITFPVLLIAYVTLGYSTDTELVFYVLALFKELGHSVGIAIPLGLTHSAEFCAALSRLSRMLRIEEHFGRSSSSANAKTNPKVEMKNVTVILNQETVLNGVNLCLQEPGLTVVTGPVGSGKSCLLKTLLNDYASATGQVNVHGTVAYAAQEPWLFPASVRQNITFGLAFDKARYDRTIRVCCLEYDFRLLANGDATLVADGGTNLSKGQQARINLARAVYRDSDIYLLDDCLAALDVTVQDAIYGACVATHLKNKIVVYVTQNPAHFKAASTVLVMERGAVKSIYKPTELFEEDLHVKQPSTEEKEEEVKEKLPQVPEDAHAQKVYGEVKRSGSVECAAYLKYLRFGGGLVVFALILAVLSGAQSTESYSSKLLSRWVDYQQQTYDLRVGNNATVTSSSASLGNQTMTYEAAVIRRDRTFNLYAILIFASAILALIKSYAILKFCRRASVKIQQAMCRDVIEAPMTFHDRHFIGNVLNRFSYDLDVIDEQLPFILMEFLRCWISIGGMLILIATVSWIFFLFALGFFVILYILRTVYIPTGRALKRLEAMTRSPLVGHLNASVEGLTTVRAYQAEDVLKDEFDKHQDLANSAYYMALTAGRAFGFVMDLTGAIFVVVIIVSLLFGNIRISVGDVGLALTQVMMLTGYLQWAVRQWADLEQCMTSVERALEYTQIGRENRLGGSINDWPRTGGLTYDRVGLSYNSGGPKVLKNVTFTARAGWKVGIVGRTGSGKSSLISALFRLYDYEGKITIDGVDVSTLSLDYLRRSISIIPQDPVIFEGTVRDNFDPHQLYTDQEIWTVLGKIQLKKLIPNLNSDVTSLNLSAGQRQLMSLGRAVLRKNKIVVLDEATANMDAKMDAMLHDVIREEFADCTVLLVAHRLSTILDCDRVLVMENGNVAEFDEPATLLANRAGLFYSMHCQSKLD